MKFMLTHSAVVAAVKRAGRALAVAALAAAAVTGPAANAAPATEYYGVTFYENDRVQVRNTSNDGLRVRTGAGLGNQTVAVMEEGTVVRVLDGPIWSNGYGWYQVTGYDSAGSSGWSAGAFLYRVGSGGEVATVARTQAPAQERTVARPAPVQQPVASGPTYNMLATAYNGAEFNSNGIMRNGERVYWGAVAVDPNVIPLGTRMYIEGYGNKVFVASDTGSAIKGYRIDIWYPTLQAAREFGAQRLTVTIIR